MSITGIAKHNDFLPRIHRREQDRTDAEYYDDMLVRFAWTFTESFESEVMG